HDLVAQGVDQLFQGVAHAVVGDSDKDHLTRRRGLGVRATPHLSTGSGADFGRNRLALLGCTRPDEDLEASESETRCQSLAFRARAPDEADACCHAGLPPVRQICRTSISEYAHGCNKALFAGQGTGRSSWTQALCPPQSTCGPSASPISIITTPS